MCFPMLFEYNYLALKYLRNVGVINWRCWYIARYIGGIHAWKSEDHPSWRTGLCRGCRHRSTHPDQTRNVVSQLFLWFTTLHIGGEDTRIYVGIVERYKVSLISESEMERFGKVSFNFTKVNSFSEYMETIAFMCVFLSYFLLYV